ncbi:FecR family protein [Chitinophaga polysaccharea]|uniref:FecR family protein n=1 Tax=Chitinophaga polysaccharea TaxID=1293035 RepID=UPI00115A66EF|nr:FecR family protein [Chitinophaga polysaccharea]
MKTKVKNLFAKYYHNTCSQEELEEVLMLLRSKKMYTAEWEAMLEGEAAKFLAGDITESGMSDSHILHLNQRIRYAIDTEKSSGRGRSFWLRMAVAAALLGFIAGTYYYTGKLRPVNDAVVIDHPGDILSGTNGATLTLSNGRKINLSATNNGVLAEEEGTGITKTAAGQITYNNAGSKQSNSVNTLATANGQIFQVQLSDGTKVWLNAASRLIYKTNLIENGKRRVQLEGEAYFEVVKDEKHPLIVSTGNQDVEVLGTAFNIEHYPDNPQTTTTLVEGKVSIGVGEAVPTKDKRRVVLQPGQQSVFSGAGRWQVAPADLEAALAWKNNEFVFDGEPIEVIMKRISRWYDVKIIYRGEKPTEKFIGSISKTNNIVEVLALLASTGGAHFTIEGRTINVMK